MKKKNETNELESSLSKQQYEQASEEVGLNSTPDKKLLFKWYIISTIHGKEVQVRNLLLKKILESKFDQLVDDLVVVVNKVVNFKTKKTIDKSLYPGYVFIHMVMDRDLWHLIRNTEGVSGFIGSSGSNKVPQPLSSTEVAKLLKQKSIYDTSDVSYKSNFSVGDLVKIKSGLFKDNSGKVLVKNDKIGSCKVEIEFMGKLIPVTIDYVSVEKI